MPKVRTRFAPSPTGTPESIHLGFVIRALWNYAFAKQNKGQFILRIEDTDRKRSRLDTEKEIYKVLQTFGISWDEGPDVGGPYGPYRQSERLEKYKKAADLLVERGFAYYDFDAVHREKEEIKASYEDKEVVEKLKERPQARFDDPVKAKKRVDAGEPYVVRAKIPEDKVFEYEDWILKKKIKFLGKEVTDMILLKSDGFPTYHLAVVVDDIDMQISHVFRGQEWISSTPIHLHVYEGLGHNVPQIGHFSVIIDPRTNKKFSKRDLTALFGVKTWLDKGYLPLAILNYLMLLGWAPKDNREVFSLEEFVAEFDQEGVQKANPIFDTNKLTWFNGLYIRKLSLEDLAQKIELFDPRFKEMKTEKGKKIVALAQERIKCLADFRELCGFFFEEPTFENVVFSESDKKHLQVAYETLQGIADWSLEEITQKLNQTIEKNGFKVGEFFMSLRIAITGKKFTPPINDSLVILGKEETLFRLKKLVT